MRIVFSRKGFDQGSGGTFSPIVDGRPISLPIPTKHRSPTTYEDLGLGDIVTEITSGKIGKDHRCHEDPMFSDNRCAFGQTGAAQSHLANQSVGVGDVFLFFGLFSDGSYGGKHHRIFGYLKVSEVVALGVRSGMQGIPGFTRQHPHFVGEWNPNNTLYIGEGAVACRATDGLRLTAPGNRPSVWRVPPWLRETGLTYHSNDERWKEDGLLEVAARGQEFVTHVGNNGSARTWLNQIIQGIRQ